jgi:cysteine-rich repeat protein
MRKSYSSYSLVTLGGLLLAGSCSIIAEVDRTKIPQDGGSTPEGGQGSGGTSGSGGTTGGTSGSSGSSGASGSSGNGGTTGEGGMGGEPGGMGGEDMGGAGMGGAGSGGAPGAECGNGAIDDGEECDDGDMPPAGNDGCSATCTEEAGWTCSGTPSTCDAAACGDRIVAGAEACDDGNNNACGTCNLGCTVATPGAAATGSISPGGAADLADGDYFTLNDGTGAQEFEFDTNSDGATRSGAAAIVVSTAGSATDLQTAIVTAINTAASLDITAAAGVAPAVTLTNDIPGTAGNQTSGEMVTSSAFTITNMTGGAGHNCATGVGCEDDDDCLSGTCASNNTCN